MRLLRLFRKLWNEESYSKQDCGKYESEEYTLLCNKILEQIDNDTLGKRARYYTATIQYCLLDQNISKDVAEKYLNCLHALWKYAKKKKYIKDTMSYDSFCRDNVASWTISP